MLKQITSIAFFLLCIFAASGCKKTGSDSLAPVTLAKGISFRLNNATFTLDSVMVSYYPWGSGSYYWETTGNNFSFPQLSFELPSMAVGNYVIDSLAYPGEVLATVANSGTQHRSKYGVLKITDSGAYIKGTFSFTCIDSTKVTNGAFNIYYHP